MYDEARQIEWEIARTLNVSEEDVDVEDRCMDARAKCQTNLAKPLTSWAWDLWVVCNA